MCSTVLILKPKVGEMVLISSPRNFFTIVVFPALSRPLYTHVKEIPAGLAGAREGYKIWKVKDTALVV